MKAKEIIEKMMNDAKKNKLLQKKSTKEKIPPVVKVISTDSESESESDHEKKKKGFKFAKIKNFL